jgi:hypothetical protein
MHRLLALAGVAAAHLVMLGAVAEAARAPAPIPCARVAGGGGTVVSITGPAAFRLDDASEVALIETGVPGAGVAGPDAAADAARDALKRALLGTSVRLYYEPTPALRADRHGRRLAQILVGATGEEGAFWLQARLVEDGALLVDSWATNRACAGALLALEATARAARQGLWADETNWPLPAERAGEARGRFALVEGTILSVKKIGPKIYLDFGADWHSALAVTIGARAARLFTKAGRDPMALQGARVRVRGYVDWGSGPEIAVTHPEMIEVLAPAPAAH